MGTLLGGVPRHGPRASQPQSVRVRWVLGLASPPGRVERTRPWRQHNYQYFRWLWTDLVLPWVTDFDTLSPGGVTDCDRARWRASPATRSRPPCACPGSHRY